jgi:hypothetical protein
MFMVVGGVWGFQFGKKRGLSDLTQNFLAFLCNFLLRIL